MSWIGNFFSERWNSPLKRGFKDNFKAVKQLGSESLLNVKEEGTPGVLGIIKQTGLNIWNTINPNSERGLFHNGAKNWWNPFEKKSITNVVNGIRKLTVGAVETVYNLSGNLIGLASPRIGNFIKQTHKNVLLAVADIFQGDSNDLSEIAMTDDTAEQYKG